MDFIKNLWYSLLQNRVKQLLGVKIHDSYKYYPDLDKVLDYRIRVFYSCTAAVSSVAWG